MRVISPVAAILTGCLIAGSGCKKADAPAPAPLPPPPAPAAVLRVTAVDLGKSILPDKSVASPTSTFAPRDTVFASVATEGTAASATIRARFTFNDGQLVNESTQTITPTGPARTEFHISRPTGWPVGKYRVDVFLDSQPAGSKEFEVKGP
jgi:hypothetical protein